MKALNIIVLLAGLFAAFNSYAAGTVLMEKHGAAWPQSHFSSGDAAEYCCASELSAADIVSEEQAARGVSSCVKSSN